MVARDFKPVLKRDIGPIEEEGNEDKESINIQVEAAIPSMRDLAPVTSIEQTPLHK